jgi:hypothetical protein
MPIFFWLISFIDFFKQSRSFLAWRRNVLAEELAKGFLRCIRDCITTSERFFEVCSFSKCGAQAANEDGGSGSHYHE